MSIVDQSWITEGGKTAVYDTGGYGGARVRYATITRITATQIVLDDGARYRRDSLRAVGERRTSFGGHTELRPVDDDRVRDVAAREWVQATVRRVAEAGADRSTVSGALAFLDEVERLVTQARSAIVEGGR